MTTKLAASTQAKVATSSRVGPKTLTTIVETDRPVISSTASKKSIPAERPVQVRTEPRTEVRTSPSDSTITIRPNGDRVTVDGNSDSRVTVEPKNGDSKVTIERGAGDR